MKCKVTFSLALQPKFKLQYDPFHHVGNFFVTLGKYNLIILGLGAFFHHVSTKTLEISLGHGLVAQALGLARGRLGLGRWGAWVWAVVPRPELEKGKKAWASFPCKRMRDGGAGR